MNYQNMQKKFLVHRHFKISGLAAFFGIPDISMTSALREASIDVNNVADGDDEIL